MEQNIFKKILKTRVEREQNKALRSRLKDMNQNGNKYRIKKWSNCAEGESDSFSTIKQ